MPSDERNTIEGAIRLANEAGAQPTGGKWLEDVTVASAPSIKEWDIARCYRWGEWPERDARFPRVTAQDIGIDCVAVRRSDGKHIAIQCKSRQLDAKGYGAPIRKEEVDSFASASSGTFWAERWIVTNGDTPLNQNAQRTLSMADRPVKMINILNDLLRQREAYITETCPHCQPEAPTDAKQAKSCMQSEAVARSVKTLKEHAQSVTGGSPVGQARGKIILPCGTGKTRISLRIEWSSLRRPAHWPLSFARPSPW